MRVLIIGGGGREHVLAWKLKQSPRVTELFCAPGNAGIARIADCVPIGASDIMEIVEFAERLRIDLTVVGPELPLTLGLADELIARDLRVFGPRKLPAAIEGNKVFAKEFMQRHDIPTARFASFQDLAQARKYLASKECPYPRVIKAAGLAAGKGVAIAPDRRLAERVLIDFMEHRKFGSAGETVVLEERLVGEEVSFLALADGEHILPLAASQDHKTLLDGNQGPNTGGMGAISPPRCLTPEMIKGIIRDIMRPTVAGLRAEGRKYQGVLYAGLMVTEAGPKVLEFNCRFGDPETQAVLPRLKGDLVEAFEAAIDHRLDAMRLEWEHLACACVVMASGGYPELHQKGLPITGLEKAEAMEGVNVFHAGTAEEDGQVVTSGGRVLGVAATAPTLGKAVYTAYKAVEAIHFEGAHYRRDIGRQAMENNHHAK